MNRIPAKTGWEWIRTGFTIFRKRPFFLVNLLFLYMMAIVLISMVPVVGQMLPVFTIAMFSFLFMNATLRVDRDEPLTFGGLFSALDRLTLFRLFALSGCYILFGLIVAGLSTVLDDGALFALIVAREGAPELNEAQMARAGYMALAIIVLYIPFFMATWFAGPLIGWLHHSRHRGRHHRSDAWGHRRCICHLYHIGHRHDRAVLFLLPDVSFYFWDSGPGRLMFCPSKQLEFRQTLFLKIPDGFLER